MKRLEGKVAVVTGASRGAGRGIAVVLGGEGATVYVTGRSVRGGATTQGLLGTVDETAEEVTARGGIAVRCDHTVDSDVEALFARLRDEHGRLDVLVNNPGAATSWASFPPPSGSGSTPSTRSSGAACSWPDCGRTCGPAASRCR